LGTPSPLETVKAHCVREQIRPGWVLLLDLADFPGAVPPFHQVFAIESRLCAIVWLEIDEATSPIAFGEPVNDAFPMLPPASGQIACGPDIDYAMGTATGHIDEEIFDGAVLHLASLANNRSG
jgi:hypothetical protein